MGVISHLLVLLEALTREDIDALVPAERQRLADALRFWSEVAEKAGQPKAGVLKDLKDQGTDS